MTPRITEWLNIIAADKEDTSTYSAMMRQLNKENPDKRLEFMRKYKEAFDEALENNIPDHQMVALMQAKKSLAFNVNYRLYKLAQMIDDPKEVGATLAQIVKIILTRSPHDPSHSYEVMRQKVQNISSPEVSKKDLPGTASYGQALTLVKTMLNGRDQTFVNQALSSLIRNLR